MFRRKSDRIIMEAAQSIGGIAAMLVPLPPSLKQRHLLELTRELQNIYPEKGWCECAEEARTALKDLTD